MFLIIDMTCNLLSTIKATRREAMLFSSLYLFISDIAITSFDNDEVTVGDFMSCYEHKFHIAKHANIIIAKKSSLFFNLQKF